MIDKLVFYMTDAFVANLFVCRYLCILCEKINSTLYVSVFFVRK